MPRPSYLQIVRRVVTVSMTLILGIGPVTAEIVETQNLGTYGSWRAYRDFETRLDNWLCVTESFAYNRPDHDNTTLYVYPTFVAFARTPDMLGREEVFLKVEDLVFSLTVDWSDGMAYSRDEDDFVALLALAHTIDDSVTIFVRDAGKVVEYEFPIGGFRDAYGIIGSACDFDARTVLEAGG